ncbi:hypothetical protein GBO14_16695 [Pseudoalteromonas shioyasakiensis]|uniref:Chitin-binding type-3 domain-containing protein n=1 Tax=Pseudoalteromonas shioyasakiensis TaxID=1190813 RepID=A0ABT6TYM6_9GAMM|nr:MULTISPECIES: hypothetical protein [Pseudoalteromonas]MCO6356361.1 hypothetical protein [Pseudoalteromonas shioyasakiensis]MDI4668496.1 hypothetical protein [Pseudoalteromonas shioyasakiensis]MDI4673621.1 hypothetical protein [Pseudoalteromonas shioyasakiensis]MDI4685830.1 hypothetical protein [Pseudoalteromonas shioyasakiensis]MDI4703698.1 hypothetical protein [Pseudoalteromonas shioyasakiensis]
MGQKSRIVAAAMITLSALPMSSFAVDSWQAGNAYPQGSETCYNEILYKARWWATPGEEPGSSQWGAWVADVASKTCVQSVVKKQDDLLKSLPTIFEPNNNKKGSSD